jgi:aryl-alcohol dehydrogenase-like predicted oxidoreductase
MTDNAIPTVPFGQTGLSVTRVGLGGEGVLRTHMQTLQAREVIYGAIAEGISYFDSAQAYAGSEGYYGTVWTESPQARTRIFQASKSASRSRTGAVSDLENTLANMNTDYLDLWQIHDVRTEEEMEMIAGPGGALEAFLEARSSGKVRSIGVTGHHDPKVLTKAVEAWPVDSVMIPVNPVEAAVGGFLTSTLPAAKEKGIAVIGMKILGASYYLHPTLGVSPHMLIRFALSHDITVGIVGCSNLEEVYSLAKAGRDFTGMSEEEMSELVQTFTPYARKLAFYRGVL